MLWLLSCTSLATCPSSSTWFLPTMIWGNWCLFIIHFFLSWYNFFLDFRMRSIHLHFFILNLNQKTLYKRLQNSSLTISKGNSSIHTNIDYVDSKSTSLVSISLPLIYENFSNYWWFPKKRFSYGSLALILERLVWSASNNISANTSVASQFGGNWFLTKLPFLTRRTG